jgi:hypothetical protein
MQASYNIEDFTINSHEIDISSAVPKLKGQSNFRDWETALYIALAANNRYYTYMISNGIPIPKIPEYQDSSPEAVRNLLIEEAQDLAGDHTTTVVISVAEIRDRVKQVIESNIVLRKEYNLKCTNWDLCNSRANLLLRGTLSPEPFSHIAQNTDVRDSFKKLRATYAVTSHQHSFARYTKWTDLRFKNGTASEFVRKFQETLRDLTSIDGKINSVYVLCQFKKAINENPKCYAFLQNLRVDEKDVNLMDQVYAEFLEVDIHNRSMNPSYNANSTTVQTSSSSHNDKKKDTKKGGNDKQSNSNNSSSNNNNKDKPSKKKTDFVREENVILCRHHGTLGNHYSNKCPLLKNSANATTIQQPQQQPLFQQVAVPQPGQIIGQVDNQGRILSLPQQQPRQGANAIFAPASYPTVPQKGPPSGDPLARYNNLFTNVLFAGIQANAVHGSHIVSKEGLLANDNNDVTRWMIDSGTSTHMTPHRSVFVNFRRCVLPVSTATGDVFYTEGYGDVILHLLDQDSSGKMAPLTLQKVWLAPDLRSSLISMSALDKADIGTWTKNGMMTFKHQDFYGPESTIGFATCEGEHYWLNCAGIDKIDHMIDCNLVTGSPNSVFATQREIIPISIDLAHRRACHAGEERVRKMEIFADGVKLKKGAGVTFPCAPCIKGKGHALPFGKERSIRSKPGEFIHLDVWGPISIASHGGEHYFVTFTDDATRFTWLFLLKSRSQVTEVYIQLETYLKTQFNYVIKKVHGDDAPEHKPLAAYLASKGTVWDPTPPYTKQLNGVAEIKNRHLVEPLVAVMAEYQLPKYLWGLLLGGINYTMNRLYASKIGMSPYEAFFGKKPNLSNLRALGCQCWFLIPKEKRNTKLDPHMEEARLLAYDEGDNYVVYNVRTKKIERSRNVIFNENPSPASLPDPAYDLNITGMNQEHEHDSQDRHIPIDFLRPHLENPFNIRSTSPPSPTVEDDPEDQTRAPNALDPSNPALFEEDLAWSNDEMAGSFGRCVVEQRVDTGAHFEAGGRGVLVEPQPVSRQVVNMDIPLETTIDLSQEDPLQDDEYHDQSPLQHDQVTFEHNFSRLDPVPDDRSRDQSYVQPIQPIQPETGQLRRSTRIKNPSRAYIESLASKSFFDSNVLRLLAEQPEILISLFANATSNEQYAVSKLTPKDIGFEPNSWEQAMSCVEKDKWLVAAHKELHRHLVNGTWRVMSRTKSKKKPLTLRWVFKVKHDGTYKARLVARGFRQVKDLDFYEVYAVVAKPMSFKVFAAVAAAKGWYLHHVDIVTAFLYAELKEPIEIELPEIQREEYPDHIGLLMKTIYGLKQSPREWYSLLHDVLVSMGFDRTQSDHSIFVKRQHGGSPLYVMVYVDDLLVLSPSEDAIQQFKSAISKHFDTSDKGKLQRYLAINVHYANGIIHLSQADYVEKILVRFGLENCKPVVTPMDEKQALIPFEGTATKGQIHEYQTKIGTLIWLMVSTRPDISFAVIKLAKHAKNPSDVHFQALKRVFRYLTGTKLLTISFHPSMQDAAVCGYCDADWAGPHSEKGLSTSGFLFKMAGGAISWTSKKQPCVALSTTESEYIAESLAVQEAIWLTQLLTELGIEGFLRKPIPIYADNNGAIALASNPEFHAATKHIAIRFHRLREEVAAGNVKFVKIPTADMAADGLTKPLGKTLFKRWIIQMGLTVYKNALNG